MDTVYFWCYNLNMSRIQEILTQAEEIVNQISQEDKEKQANAK